MKVYNAVTLILYNSLFQVKVLKDQVASLRDQCRQIKKETLQQKIEELKLPQEQELMIKSCMKTAKVAANGRRYDLKWIYECILMRIKSPTLYNHLRLRKILPLPCRSTLNRYMRKLHPMYGYQDTLFETVKKKVSGFAEVQRHGEYNRWRYLNAKYSTSISFLTSGNIFVGR